MNLKDMITKAIKEQDPRLAGRLADHLRFNAGMTYTQIFELVNRYTGIELGDWDALLMEYEELQEAAYNG